MQIENPIKHEEDKVGLNTPIGTLKGFVDRVRHSARGAARGTAVLMWIDGQKVPRE